MHPKKANLHCHFFNEDSLENAPRRIQPGSVDLILTDPPYGIDGHTLHKHYNRNEDLVLEDYAEVPAAEYEQFSRRWIGLAADLLRPGGSLYAVSGWTNLRDVLNALAATDLQLVNHIIWRYNFGVFTRRKFVTSHYHILYAVKPGGDVCFNTHARYAPTDRTSEDRSVLYGDMEDVWIINREYKTGQVRNKNELPTALLAKILQYSTNEGDLVVDLFAGSFSTAKVAKGLNRSSLSFEISHKAFEHQAPLVESLDWGWLLDDVPKGADTSPANLNKPWTEDDLDALEARYNEIRSAAGTTKRQAIATLQEELGRGYFSIYNALKRRGL